KVSIIAPIAAKCFANYALGLMKSEASIFTSERHGLRVTFLVLTGASIMCVASAIDPLRAANRISGTDVFEWSVVSADGKPPLTSCGMPIAVSGALDPTSRTDVFVVIAGFGNREQATQSLLSGIRRLAKTARAYGGVEAGAWLIARAGLLEGRAATTHWEDIEDFAAAFPGSDVRPDRYVIDGPA